MKTLMMTTVALAILTTAASAQMPEPWNRGGSWTYSDWQHRTPENIATAQAAAGSEMEFLTLLLGFGIAIVAGKLIFRLEHPPK
jgi:hypothetical protein